MLDAALRLVELQADAGIPAGDRDFTGYVANVLFDDWDEVWADAARACAAAGPLCARLRRWLQPVWGLRLPPADYAHNDLNLSNILTDGARITGVVDWDEFGLGSRALDLVALALDCERGGDHAAADRLLARAARVAGGDGLRCLVSYRAIAGLAVSPTSGRRTAIPSGMRSARPSRPSSTGFRRPAAPDSESPVDPDLRLLCRIAPAATARQALPRCDKAVLLCPCPAPQESHMFSSGQLDFRSALLLR